MVEISLSHNTLVGGLAAGTGISIAIIAAMILLKGFALYYAARMKKQGWFWVMLIIVSFGILPAIFLLMNKDKLQQVKK